MDKVNTELTNWTSKVVNSQPEKDDLTHSLRREYELGKISGASFPFALLDSLIERLTEETRTE